MLQILLVISDISNFLKKPINRHLQLCKEHVFATFQIIYSRHPKMTEVKWHKRNVPKTMVGSKSPDCLVILEGYTENLHKAFKFKVITISFTKCYQIQIKSTGTT